MSEVQLPKVVRMQNPDAVNIPEIRALFERAFDQTPLLPEWSHAGNALTQAITDPKVGIFVGVEQGLFKGLLIVTLPLSDIDLDPFVWLFYVGRPDRQGASAALRTAMANEGVAWLVQNGYTAFRANCPHTSKKMIAAWQRLFRKAGKSEEVGKLMRFQIGA